MKQRFSLYLLVLCLLLTACRGTSGQEFDDFQPMPGFDAQDQYMMTEAVRVQETEQFFCGGGLEFRYLHYYDKASGISGVLCDDPACSHYPDECRGYVGMGGAAGMSVSWYDGALYWVAPSEDSSDRNYYLWRDDLSGAGREQVKRISYEDFLMVYQPQWYTIHRGKLYFLGSANAVTEADAGKRVTLVSIPLDEFEEPTVLYDNTGDSGYNAMVRFAGNSVYLSMEVWDDESRLADLTITKFDTTTGDAEVIYEETGIAEAVAGFWVTEQSEVYLALQAYQLSGSVWKVEDGKRTEVISWEGDDFYIKLMDGIAANFTAEKQENGDYIRYVDIKNYAGETLYSGELFPEGIPGVSSITSFSVVGGDAEKIVLKLKDWDSGIKYMVMVDLSNMKPTVLWSE